MSITRICDQVKQYRKAHKLSQQKLAQYCGVPTRLISSLENDKTDELKVHRVHIQHIKHLLGIIHTDTPKKYEKKRTDRTRRQHKAIIQLAKHPSVLQADLTKSIQLINEVLVDVLHTSHAAVWLLDDTHEELRCLDIYQCNTQKHIKESNIVRKQYPIFFETIDRERTIDAYDAQNDPRINEFREAKLLPKDITSSLDSAIWLQGKTVGLINIEHVGEKHQWSTDEITFCGAIADLIGQLILSSERNLLQIENEKQLEYAKNLQETIIRLSTHEHITNHNFNKSIRLINKVTTQVLNSNASGLWIYKQSNNTAECVDAYHIQNNKHLLEPNFSIADTPHYIEALNKERTIAINNSKLDSRINEFNHTFIEPFSIGAAMDSGIRVEGKLIGVFSTDDKKNREWTTDEIAFHGSVSDLISQLTLIEEQKQRLQRLEKQQQAIVEIFNHKTITSGDIKGAAKLITRIMAKELNVDCCIWIMSENDDYLYDIREFGKSIDLHESTVSAIKNDNPKYFAALEHERTIAAHDCRLDPRTTEFSQHGYIPNNIFSTLESGIRISDKLSGVLICEQSEYSRHWTAEEIAFSGTIADLMAKSLNNNFIINKLRQAQLQQATISKISTHKAVTHGDTTKVAELISKYSSKILKVDFASIYLFQDNDKNYTKLNAYKLNHGFTDAPYSYQVSTYKKYFDLLKNERVIDASDCQNDPRTEIFNDVYKQYGIHSSLASGIRVAGKVIGGISLYHMSPRTWTNEEITFIGVMADQMAQAFINNERYNQKELETYRLEQNNLQKAALLKIATHKSIINGDILKAAMLINETTADILNIDYTDISLFSEDNLTLTLIDEYTATTGHHKTENTDIYYRKDFPKYFSKLENERVIAINNRLNNDHVIFEEPLLGQKFALDAIAAVNYTIRASGKISGIFAVSHRKERHWNHDEISFITAMGDQFTQALLNNKRIIHETEKQHLLEQSKRQHDALMNLSTHQSITEGDVKKSYHLATETICNILNTDNAEIWFINGHEVNCIDAYNKNNKQHTKHEKFLVKDFPDYYKLLNTKRAVTVDDISNHQVSNDYKKFADSYKPTDELASAIYTSIILSGKVIGHIEIEQYHKTRKWTSDESVFSIAVADYVAQLIHNTERKDQLNRNKARLKRSTEQQDAILMMSTHSAIIEGDIESTSNLATKIISKVLNTPYGYFTLFSENNTSIKDVIEYSNSDNKHYSGDTYNTEKYPEYFQALEQERTLAISDIQNDKRTSRLYKELYLDFDCASGLDSCIRLSGKTIGLIGVDDTSIRKWHADEIAFIAAIADQMVQVFNNNKRKKSENAFREIAEQREELHSIINSSQSIVFLWLPEENWPVSYVSENIKNLGYTPNDFYNGSVSMNDIIHPDDFSNITNKGFDHNNRENINTIDHEYRVLTKGGKVIWMEEKTQIRRDKNGKVTQYHGILHDITNRKQNELNLIMLSSALEQSASAVAILDKSGRFEFVNRRFSEVTGYNNKTIIGKNHIALHSKDAPSKLKYKLFKTIEAGEEWRGEIVCRKNDNSNFWTHTSISPIKQNNEITQFVAVIEDISESKLAHKKMEQLAFYDTLTGLENRRLFKEHLEQAIKSAQRHQKDIALLYLDLDHFKLINDTMGHDAGDTLLQTIATRLLTCVRGEDTVARIGGDEFTVLLTDVDSINGIETVARKIVSALRKPIQLQSQKIVITVSLGITLSPTDSVNSTVLLKNADMAMYKAKSLGRNNYQFFSENLNFEISERLFLENELRTALRNEQFTIHYQPILRISDQSVVAMEALLRWQHPERGLIPPNEFISVAEDMGLIVPIGKWVLNKACTYTKQLQDKGHAGLKVAVNLSPQQFDDSKLIDFISKMLKRLDLNANSLELEITETMLMNNIEKSIITLEKLKALGISLSVDDFGTGYSSLSYLKRLPINNVKIDRSFIHDIPNDNSAMEITTAVIAMAHKLHLTVIAEGVETPEQHKFLNDNDCNLGQGFLYSHPVSSDELSKSIKDIRTKNKHTSRSNESA